MSVRMDRLAIAGLALLVLDGSVLRAEDSPPSGGPRKPPPTLVRTVGLDLRDLVRLPRTLDAKGWRKLGLGLASVAVAASADSSVHDRFQNSATPGNERLARDLRPLGQAGGIALIGIGWGVGKLAGRPELASTSADAFEATLIAGGLLAPVLKEVVGRARPSAGKGSSSFKPFSSNASFPSGEATEAFAIASVVAAHYRRPWIQASAWTAAAIVAEGRLRMDAHWLSDVVGGALLGGGVGTWIVHEHRRRAEPRDGAVGESSWMLAPTAGPATRSGRRRVGLALTIAW